MPREPNMPPSRREGAPAATLAVLAALALGGCGDAVVRLSNVIAGSPVPSKRIKAAVALGKLRDPAASPALLRALGDPDRSVRAEAARALGPVVRYGSDDVEKLARCLDDPWGEVRVAAAGALGVARDPRVAGKLVRCLGDRESGVRAAAARALGRIRSDVALAGLRQAASDPEPDVRAAALKALSRAAGLEATADLQRALADPDGKVRLVAVKGLAERPSVSSAPLLAGALADPVLGVAWAAAGGLVELRGPRAAPGLTRVAEAFPGELRLKAVLALAETPGPEAGKALASLLVPAAPGGKYHDGELRGLAADALGAGRHPEAADALARSLADPSVEVARKAAYALAAYGRAEGLGILLEDIRAGPRRGEAMDAVARLGPRAALALEGVVADAGATVEARLAAIMVLAELRPGRSVPALTQALECRRGELRAAAALALGEIGDAGALEAVWRIIDDRDRRVRLYAAYAACRLGNSTRIAALGWAAMTGREPERHVAVRLLSRIPGGRAAEMLVRGLAAPERAVRSLAARGLARKGLEPPEVRQRVIDALGALARDTDAGVRESAASALGGIATAGSVEALAEFASDPATGVRLAVCRAILEAAGASAEAARAGALLASTLLDDPSPAVVAASLGVIERVTGQSFGLPPGRAPTAGEVREAALRARLWCTEHLRKIEDR